MGMLHKVEEVLRKKQSFYDELKCELDMHSADDLVMCLGYFNGHVGRHIDSFDGVHGGYGVGQRNLEGRMLLNFCLEKELYVSDTWFRREDKGKVTFRMSENETDLVSMKIELRQFIQNVKAIPGEFQHSLVIADIDKRKIRKVVRKTCAERRKITLQQDVKIRKRFEEKVAILVSIAALNLGYTSRMGIFYRQVMRQGGRRSFKSKKR